MKLTFDRTDKYQPDPFIFEDAGKFYIYVTNNSEPNGTRTKYKEKSRFPRKSTFCFAALWKNKAVLLTTPSRLW